MLASRLPPLWRQRDYMLLWSSQVVSNLGANASGIVYPLLILALTGSPSRASFATVLRVLPYLLLSLPVGALIDRWDRRRVMITCHLGRAIALSSLPLAMWLGTLTLPHIYVVAVVEGSFHVFFNIAEVAALARVVPTGLLPQATAQNQAGGAAATVAGPALGTWLYQTAGRGMPFALDALAHIFGAFAMWRMRTSFVPAPQARASNLRREVAEGLRWLWRQRLVRDMALITSGVNFMHAAMPLLLIVLAKNMGASEAQIGSIFSIGGLGAIGGALVGGAIQRRFSFGQVIIGTLAIQAASFPLYAACTSTWALGAIYAVIMFCQPVYNVVQFSHRVSQIPDGLQGRVNSSFRLIANLLHPVGAALCGWVLEHGSAHLAVGIFGTLFVGLATVTALDEAVRGAPRYGAVEHPVA